MKPRFFSNYLTILIIIIAFVAFKWHYLDLPFFWDEAWPYSTAVHAMYEHGLSLKPNAISPEISRGHPLLFHCLAAGWMMLFGTSIATLHLFALFTSALLLLTAWLFCKTVFSKSAGFIACLLFAVQPIFMAQSGLLLPEVLVALLSTAGLFAYLIGKNWLYFVFAILLLLTKESGVVLPFSIFVFELLRYASGSNPSNLKTFLTKSFFILSPLIVLVTHFVLAKKIYGWYVYPEYEGFISFNITTIFSRMQSIATYVFFYYGRFVYVLIALISLAVIYSGKKKETSDNKKTLLIIFCITYFLFSALNLCSPRYYLTLIVLLTVLFSAILVNAFEEKKKILYTIVSALFILSASFNMVNGTVYDHMLDYANGVEVNRDVVEFCESNNWYDKQIHARFLTMKSLTDPCSGYLKGKKFNSVNDGTPENTDIYILTSMENDNSFNELKTTRNLQLVKRFVHNNAWAEIYILPRPEKGN